MTAEEVVRTYWALMGTNDFDAVGKVLHATFRLEWPQSNECIRGADRFARMNAEYPAQGRWRFAVRRLVANAHEVATEVDVTDGVQRAKAISFFTIEQEKIARLVEFWPEPYDAPVNRAHLVEPLEARQPE